MPVPEHFSTRLSLQQQVVYVLSLQEEGTPEEIAMELIELRGIASEERVADLTVAIENELQKMEKVGLVRAEKETGQPSRYRLQNINNL